MKSYPGRPFRLPVERAKMLARYWPPRVAARKWGCSYRDAVRHMLRHPEICCEVRVTHADGQTRWTLCAIADEAEV